MGIMSRMNSCRHWATLAQLLAADLVLLLVELTESSADTNEVCGKPSRMWSFMPVFRRSLTALMGVSHQECLLQHRRRHLHKALAADAFVLFLRLRALSTFLRIYFASLLKQIYGGQHVSEEDKVLKISISVVPQQSVTATPPCPPPDPRGGAVPQRRASL